MLIPSVLALLGDNPMQSELSCHVGLNGNKFCRICKTESNIRDQNGDPAQAVHLRNQNNVNGDESDSSMISCASANSASNNNINKRGKKKATLAEMIQSARLFLTVCMPQ